MPSGSKTFDGVYCFKSKPDAELYAKGKDVKEVKVTDNPKHGIYNWVVILNDGTVAGPGGIGNRKKFQELWWGKK